MQESHVLFRVMSTLDQYELNGASQYLECLKACCSFDAVLNKGIRRDQPSFASAHTQPASPDSDQDFGSLYNLFVKERIAILETKLVQDFDEFLSNEILGNKAVELFAGAVSAHNLKINFDGKVKIQPLYVMLASRLTAYCELCISLAAQYLGEDSSAMVDQADKQLQNVQQFLLRFSISSDPVPFVPFPKIQSKYDEQEQSLEFAQKQMFSLRPPTYCLSEKPAS